MTVSDFTPYVPTAEDGPYLMSAYDIVYAINAMVRQANFKMTVDLSEKTETLQRLTDSAPEVNVKPKQFIAVHALGICAAYLEDHPDIPRAEGLKAFIYEAARNKFGEGFCENLKSYVRGETAKGVMSSDADVWERLGMTRKSLWFLHQYSAMPQDLVSEKSRSDFAESAKSLVEQVESCGDMGAATKDWCASLHEQISRNIQTGRMHSQQRDAIYGLRL